MSETQESLHLEDGLFAHSLNDYRLKVEDIIRAENERFSKLAEEQAKAIIHCALQKAQEITVESERNAAKIVEDSQQQAQKITVESERKAAKIIEDSQQQAQKTSVESERKAAKIIEDTQQQAQKTSNEIQQKANQRYSELINEAQQKAQQILQKAEEEATIEAKNRVKAQEEKILTKMREESHSILTTVKKNAEKEKNDIIEKAKKEAKQYIEEEVARVKAEAQAKSAKISADAEQKAANMINALVTSSNEVNDMIVKAIKKSETIMEKMKSDMNTEVGELTKTMVIARSKLEQVAMPAPDTKSKEDGLLQKNNKDTDKNNTAVWVALEGERTAPRGDGTFFFKGKMELKTLASASSTTFSVIKSLKDIFNRAPNVQYGGESCSEKEFSTKYEIKVPLPIVDILNNIPLVKEVVVRDDGLKLVLD